MRLHIYFNTELITIHKVLNNNKEQLIYQKEHYLDNIELSRRFKSENIEEIAQSNLNKLGEKFNDSIPTTNK